MGMTTRIVLAIVCFMLIIVSYIHIFWAVLRMTQEWLPLSLSHFLWGNTTIQATAIFCLLCCGYWRLPHFLCEMTTMLKLAYVDVRANEIHLLLDTLVLILLPLSLITVSYGSIARAMLRIKSPLDWRKSLGTCGSHRLVVTPFYGTNTVVYIWPYSSFSGTFDKFLTLFYTVVTPTLNPLIYTLRSKDVKGVVRRILGKDPSSEKG
ncbi:putative olfactory receptor 2B8 [Tachyglossus aculeatus]|uniref:putative olfactory receptor 2B8 n=1 Tax=Tachyglossus aculeatus TaxID=9261 RepID=UPI0018F3E40B|nr:putative olfactory receptor 2B8 [Tachyglossus aculeatus]